MFIKAAILVMLATSSVYLCGNFEDVSKKIQEKTTGKKFVNRKNSYHDIRMRLYNKGYLRFLDSNSTQETVFIETNILESGDTYGTVWRGRDTLSYSYYNEVFNLLERSPFSDKLIKLVGDKDTITIRRKEKLQGGINRDWVYVSRYKCIKNKYAIEVFKFQDYMEID